MAERRGESRFVSKAFLERCDEQFESAPVETLGYRVGHHHWRHAGFDPVELYKWRMTSTPSKNSSPSRAGPRPLNLKRRIDLCAHDVSHLSDHAPKALIVSF